MQLRSRGKRHRKKEGANASSRDHGPQGHFPIRQAQAHSTGESASGREATQARSLWSAPRQNGRRGLPIQMIGPAKIYFIIFGLLTIVGGVIGFVKAGSTASLVAGAISGIALLVAAFLLPGNVAVGLIIAGVVSLLLAGRFIPSFMQTGKIMPAGLMAILSAIGVIMAIVAWIKR